MTLRPKRPTRPPKPPVPEPPLPAVVTPEDLVAVNVPATDKMPAYYSPGKFEWQTPPPGPKGEQGEPGEPGAPGVIARPITPAVTAEEIAPGAVTEEKLATDSVTQTKIARNSVGWSEIREQSLEPEQIKTLSGEPATEGQIPVADLSQENQWWFRWADAVTRPLTPPVTTDEIGDGQVTPEKLSFTPLARPLTPGVATDEIANGAVTPEKLSVAPLRMVTGTYTGDGTPTQAIIGLGFQPQVILIYPQVDGPEGPPFIKTNRDGTWAGFIWARFSYWAYREDIIISLDADGFTVGTTQEINTSGRIYTYIALG